MYADKKANGTPVELLEKRLNLICIKIFGGEL
jgi:hypothetical protein